MSSILGMHRATGTVSFSVNGVTHSSPVGDNESCSHLLQRTMLRGCDPAETLRFLAVLGVHIWHPGHSPAADLLSRWERYFGSPVGCPNGSLIGAVILNANGKKFVAEVRGGDYYDSYLIRAHLRGEDAAKAFMFLAEVGTRLYTPDHQMLGGMQRKEASERFSQ